MAGFIDRTEELAQLENEYNKKEASLFILYGRRRIGKTKLLEKFSENKDPIFFIATAESEKENMNSFRKCVAVKTKNKLLEKAKVDSWDDIFECALEAVKEKKLLIIIDEFQYIGKSNPAFVSRLQKIWDSVLSKNNVMLVLCGSLVNMMYSQTLSYSSPLYGRRTGLRKLKQIPFKYYGDFYPSKRRKELIEYYSVTGGIPKYIQTFNFDGDIYSAVEKCVISKESYLYDEPTFLLSGEVQEIGSYFSIIKTIANGKEKQSEIASALEIKSTSLPKYLKTLIDLDIIEREVPVTETNPEKSKMGLYKIKDNFIRFWFKFIYPYKPYLETDNEKIVIDRIKKTLISNHTAYVYEELCRREFIYELISGGAWDFIPSKIGRWWDRSDQEIDIVALDEEGENIIFGECKFTNKETDTDVFYSLTQKTKYVKWHNDTRKEHFVLFSEGGYTEKMKKLAKEKNIILY